MAKAGARVAKAVERVAILMEKAEEKAKAKAEEKEKDVEKVEKPRQRLRQDPSELDYNFQLAEFIVS